MTGAAKVYRACLFAVAIPGVILISGCVSSVNTTHPWSYIEHVALADGQGTASPYPGVVLGIALSTSWHRWQDPEETPYTESCIATIDLLKGQSEEHAQLPPATDWAVFPPFIVKRAQSACLFLSPGFNPTGWGNFGTEACRKAQPWSGRGFWSRYWEIRDEHPEYDVDYVAAEEAASAAHRAGSQPAAASTATRPTTPDEDRPVTFRLIPLYGPATESEPPGVVVNHSILIFMLELDGVWRDLKRLYRQPEKRAAVVLVCDSVVALVEAHEQKWRGYVWTTRQRSAIDWCRSIAQGPPDRRTTHFHDE